MFFDDGGGGGEEVSAQIISFLLEFLPWMIGFVIGCVGGRLTREMGVERGLSPHSLGPAAIFSLDAAMLGECGGATLYPKLSQRSSSFLDKESLDEAMIEKGLVFLLNL